MSTGKSQSLGRTILQSTLSEWIWVISLVFGGCCSNVFALEAVLQSHRGAGIFLTFLQFSYVTITTLSTQLTFVKGSFLPRLTPRVVPLTKWFVQVALFLTVSVLNNYAFGLKVPVPVHIIFRSGGLGVSMFMGWLVGGKKYTFAQVSSVALITAGIVLSTISAPSRPKPPLSNTHSSSSSSSAFTTQEQQTISASEASADTWKYALGIATLSLALVLSSLMGLWQEKIYKRYGAVWKEGLFYNHVLSLPFFLPMYSSFQQDVSTLTTNSTSINLALPGPISTMIMGNLPMNSYSKLLAGIVIPSAWIAVVLNLMTQGVCITGVNRLTAKVSSVTVNLVLTVRKAVSLAISVWYFGSGFNSGLAIGASMVLLGTVTYSWTNLPNKGEQRAKLSSGDTVDNKEKLVVSTATSTGHEPQLAGKEGLRNRTVVEDAASKDRGILDDLGSPIHVEQNKPRYTIALISDFFLPIAGGVEVHIYSLGVELQRLGHRVIVVTHSHPPSRIGIRHISSTFPLKTYYLPITPIAASATLPNFLLTLPYLRNILIREQVQVVHAHSSLTSMGHEGIWYGGLFKFRRYKNVGGATGEFEEKTIRTVFTDHSLFGLDDAVGILTNKLLAGVLRNVDKVICVSHTARENTALRAELELSSISVIPNALVPDRFMPDPGRADPDYITIVVVSRLVYRKGIDLLVAAVPSVCELFPRVRFIIGGDGPKMVELEQMREQNLLQDRVELLGTVPNNEVRDVLNRGQIYLATSLTEAFGISIVEAACAGLFVVSTKVGGVPEVLPEDLIEYAIPDAEDVIRALTNAIKKIKLGTHNPYASHERLRKMYSWQDVAERTIKVYDKAMDREELSMFDRMDRLLELGPFFGPILCIITSVQSLFLMTLDWLYPREEIDIVPN